MITLVIFNQSHKKFDIQHNPTIMGTGSFDKPTLDGFKKTNQQCPRFNYKYSFTLGEMNQVPINAPVGSIDSKRAKYVEKLSDSSTGRVSASPKKVSPRIRKDSGKDVIKLGEKITAKCTICGDKNKVEEHDNSYEKKLRSDIVAPDEIDVSFRDVGALEETKNLICELIILPLKRPELFTGGLLKPCRGILLFGPPGTGKTMLAKAIAKESGANFINVSLSSIMSMWVGESNKNVKALFTLAAKVAPTVIFLDEIDSMLGKRNSVEHDIASRNVKNEFMSLWDGLKTKVAEQVLVLGATNRPFDLDEAIIRRFERRILVGLPSKSSRESIFKKLLARENVNNINYEELALMTEGYTGSDLKNLCTTAAYQPLRELLVEEALSMMVVDQTTTRKPVLRALNMDDIRRAKKQVGASFSANGSNMKELEKWNNIYGEGGSRSLE